MAGVSNEVLSAIPNVMNPTKEIKTFKISSSSALSRAKMFVPALREANDALQKQIETTGSGKFDIENVDGCADSVIEMNFALFEAEEDSSDKECSDSSDSDCSDCDCDEMSCSCVKPPKYGPLESLKLPSNGSIKNRTKTSKPIIEILPQTSSAAEKDPTVIKDT